jgi:hypothetical protein
MGRRVAAPRFFLPTPTAIAPSAGIDDGHLLTVSSAASLHADRVASIVDRSLAVEDATEALGKMRVAA